MKIISQSKHSLRLFSDNLKCLKLISGTVLEAIDVIESDLSHQSRNDVIESCNRLMLRLFEVCEKLKSSTSLAEVCYVEN